MKPCNGIQHCNCGSVADAGRRRFVAGAAAGLGATAVFPTTPAKTALDPDRRKFMEEATRLANESVHKGWGGPFGAVIVKDGEIIGRRTECSSQAAPCTTQKSPPSSTHQAD
jgi:hypothetical protein